MFNTDSQQKTSFCICLKSQYFKLNIPHFKQENEKVREASICILCSYVIELIKKMQLVTLTRQIYSQYSYH